MLEDGFAALDSRVDAARREVAGALDERVRGLHDDQRETRDHVRGMSDHLARADHAVPTLRDDITTLTSLVRTLHTDLGNLADRLLTPETTAKSTDDEQPVPAAGQAVPTQTPQDPPPVAEPGNAAQPPAPATTPQGATVTTEPTPGEQPSQEENDQALKRAVEAAYRGAPAGQPAPAPQPPAAEAQDPRVAHGVLLLRAAGVALAEVIAHRHTWEWLAGRAAGHDHFRTPPAIDDLPDGRITTTISGRSLIALLIVLWEIREASGLDGDWALATTAYQRADTALSGVTDQGTTIRIVLDDGYDEAEEDSDGPGPARQGR
ncbi:hypothetical protein [Streptomyces sp. NPDC048659]|uniref:hypothetical protein n=1 Tax=Streptomyces sp. NPDC048659 TaxID=3155489 RepID=UPI00344AA8DB